MMSFNTREINISAGTLIHIVAWGLGLYALYLIRDIVALLCVALIFAAALDPTVTRLERKGISRGISMSFILFFVSLGLITTLISVVPVLATQWERVMEQVPRVVHLATSLLSNIDPKAVETLVISFEKVRDDFFASANILATVTGGLQAIFSVVVCAVLTFYLVLSQKDFRTAYAWFFPPALQAPANNLLTRVQLKLGSWLRAQIIVIASVTIAYVIVLIAWGVPDALILALFAGVLEIVPYFGSFVGALPALMVAFGRSPLTALGVAIAFLIIQQLQSHYLTPRLQGKNAGLNPLLIILAVLIGGRLNGVVGTLLAVPIATVISVALTDYNERWPREDKLQ